MNNDAKCCKIDYEAEYNRLLKENTNLKMKVEKLEHAIICNFIKNTER